VAELTVVIPTFNGGIWLEHTLQKIFQQSIIEEMEILVIDSGSSDNTLNVLKKYPIRIHEIPNKTFNHGSTRNLGTQLAKGRFVLFTVQDACPASNEWAEKMLSNFNSERISAVCGGQAVPHDKNKNPIQWYRPQSRPQKASVFFKNKENFDSLNAQQKNRLCSWDNVNAIYRRKVLLEVPFQHISFAEDMAWAKDALRASKELIYDFSNPVFHYHHQNKEFTYKRTLADAYFRYELTGFRAPVPERFPIRAIISWIKTLTLTTSLSPKETIYWLKYNYSLHKGKWKALKEFNESVKGGSKESLYKLYQNLSENIPVSLKTKE
jgi:rhamnosyltransferase